jgi:hypothetical protein
MFPKSLDINDAGISTSSYVKIYPIVADALEKGEEVTIEYVNRAA